VRRRAEHYYQQLDALRLLRLEGRKDLLAEAEVIEEAFLDLLARLSPHPERMRFLEEVYREVWNERNASKDHDAENLRRELEKLQKRKETAQERMLDGHVSGEEYADITRKVSVKLQTLRIGYAAHQMNRSMWRPQSTTWDLCFGTFDTSTKPKIYAVNSVFMLAFSQKVSQSPRMGFGTSQPILFTYC